MSSKAPLPAGPPNNSEAFPFRSPPKYLLRDRDGIYSLEFQRRAEALGLEQVRIAPHSPWQSPYVERLIGSVRPSVWITSSVLNQAHLHRLLKSYFAYYHRSRTHLSLDKDAPDHRPVQVRRRERSLPFPKWADSIIATNAWRPEITMPRPGESSSPGSRRSKRLRPRVCSRPYHQLRRRRVFHCLCRLPPKTPTFPLVFPVRRSFCQRHGSRFNRPLGVTNRCGLTRSSVLTLRLRGRKEAKRGCPDDSTGAIVKKVSDDSFWIPACWSPR